MALSSDPRPGPGLGAALGALAASAIGLVRTRLELASVELAEEKEHAKQLLLLAACGILAGSFTLLFASLWVIVYFWDTYRLAATGAVTIFYLAVAALIFARLRRRGSRSHTPFAATMSALEEDAASLRGHR